MKSSILDKIVGSFTLFLFMLATTHAVAASPDLLKAKKEAETKGYIFYISHDEIVTMAKKEGKLRVSTGQQPQSFKPLTNGFRQKYPFITDIQVEEIRGNDSHQRFILEMKSGLAKGWDVAYIPLDFAQEYPPYLMKHDILGMAKHGVLKIPPGMISPVERNMVSVGSVITVVPYNRNLLPDDKVPAKWEDFLKPEFKGKKFVVDLRPLALAALVPAWGLEKTLDFARKLAAQEPVWTRGGAKVNAAVAAGEYSLFLGPAFSTIKRAMSKDPTGSLRYKVIEPVPARVVNHPGGILNTANHPHGALLWLEFLASPEGQEILDKYEPYEASVFSPGSALADVTRGKQLSMVDWNHFTKFQEYQEKIFAAYGFPKADK